MFLVGLAVGAIAAKGQHARGEALSPDGEDQKALFFRSVDSRKALRLRARAGMGRELTVAPGKDSNHDSYPGRRGKGGPQHNLSPRLPDFSHSARGQVQNFSPLLGIFQHISFPLLWAKQ